MNKSRKQSIKLHNAIKELRKYLKSINLIHLPDHLWDLKEFNLEVDRLSLKYNLSSDFILYVLTGTKNYGKKEQEIKE